MQRIGRFGGYAWAVLVVTVGVVLWGGFVRFSGSGDGCGPHWPLCHGAVLPQAPAAETLIELAHRLSSGLALLLVAGLLVWSRHSLPHSHPARAGALTALACMVIESLIGAALVLFSLTAQNSSLARAILLPLHLLNTLLLLGALTLTAWWGSRGPHLRLRGQGAVLPVVVAGLLGTMLLGATGALTSLADQLFPPRTMTPALYTDLTDAGRALVDMRAVHPFIAATVGAYLILATWLICRLRPGTLTHRLGLAMLGLYLAQAGVGVFNVLLHIPLWSKTSHMLLANLTWITLVLLAASALAQQPASPPQPELVARPGYRDPTTGEGVSA